MNTEKTLKLTPDVFTELTDSQLISNSQWTLDAYKRQTGIWYHEITTANAHAKSWYNGRLDAANVVLQFVESLTTFGNTSELRKFLSVYLESVAQGRRKAALANDQDRANYFAGKESALYHYFRSIGVRYEFVRFCIESAEKAMDN